MISHIQTTFEDEGPAGDIVLLQRCEQFVWTDQM
jgi:hypothetical protein